MITFTPIASSSKGNAYLLESEGAAPLLIEAGIPFKKIQEAVGFQTASLAGALISHEHLDHARAVKDLLRGGVDCWMSKGTAEALDVANHHRTNVISGYETTLIGHWMTFSFPLEHDAIEPCGFFILRGLERLLFIPDTGYVKDRFNGITILAVECNFQEEKLTASILNGAIPAVAGHRIRRNHLSLERLIDLLKANDLSHCREVWLLHLSAGNSDERQMIKAVQKTTGIPVRVANE